MRSFPTPWLGIGLLGVAALTGCNTTFVQRGHSPGELATITTVVEPGATGSGTDDRALSFAKLDGKSLSNQFLLGTPTEVRVAPGRHVLLALYRHGTLSIDHRIEVDFSPGDNYQLHEGTEGDGPRFWLTRQGSSTRIPI